MVNTKFVNTEHVIVSKEDWDDICYFVERCVSIKDAIFGLDENDPKVIEAKNELYELVVEVIRVW